MEGGERGAFLWGLERIMLIGIGRCDGCGAILIGLVCVLGVCAVLLRSCMHRGEELMCACNCIAGVGGMLFSFVYWLSA